MAGSARCEARDFNGTQCGLAAGHAGAHGPAIATRERTSFARILVTPIALLVAAGLFGAIFGYALPLLALAAVISIVYIVVASRR